MELSTLDRIIIVRSLLPETGTIDQIKLVMSLKSKIGFSEQELTDFKIFEPYKGMLEIPGITLEMMERSSNFDITMQELELLKTCAQSYNDNGWVTVSSLDTIEYILNYTLE